MIPILFKIGPLTVYSYGMMLAIAVVVCSFFLSREAGRIGIKPEMIYDLIFWMVLSGILGARIFFILLNLPFFLQNPLEIIMIQKGGLAWQGSLVGGMLAGILFIKRKGCPIWKTLDLLAPYGALGQAIGRMGCFLNGCCFGQKVPWGIYFPVHDARLHPTQLYLSGGLLGIFFVLKFYSKIPLAPFTKGGKVVDGQIFVLYLLLASSWRFCVEFFRADHTQIFFGLSIFQMVCLGFMGIALYVFIHIQGFTRK